MALCVVPNPTLSAAEVYAQLAKWRLLSPQTAEALAQRLFTEGLPWPLEGEVADFAETITRLARKGWVRYQDHPTQPTVALIPETEHFSWQEASAQRWVLSPFQYLRPHAGAWIVRDPQVPGRLEIYDSALLTPLGQYATEGHQKTSEALQALLVGGGLLVPAKEDSAPHSEAWEFHDLLFHQHTRLGLGPGPIGKVPPHLVGPERVPALRPNPWAADSVALPTPSVKWSQDPPFSQVMSQRRSVRAFSPVPPTLAELGELLYRVQRVVAQSESEGRTYTERPYPAGGALYELELFITVQACAGLPRGLYYYDALHHRLCRVAQAGPETEAQLRLAQYSVAGSAPPPLLLHLVARHGRVSQGYRGIAYALQLKHVGVLFQTLYLTATALGLGGCALGAGNPTLLQALTGADPMEENVLGEFILGRPLPLG